MTFGELLEMVRREVIVDDYSDAYQDADVYDVLWKGSVDIASAFDIPRAIQTVSVDTGNVTVTPSPVPTRIHSLNIAGDDAVSVDLQELLRMRHVGPGPIRYFNFDPRRAPSDILISPASIGGAATIEYTAALVRPGGSLAAVEPWLGALPQFHNAIAYRVGVTLYEMAEREDEAAHWMQQYEFRATEMAGMLGRTDMGNLMIQREQRNDAGSAG